MFGLGKNKSVTVEDESIKDKSKFVVVGFTVMVLTFFVFVISEIYTSFQLSKQKKVLASADSIQKESDNFLIKMAKAGKEVNKNEYEYIKEIMMFMSPTEFQNFKNLHPCNLAYYHTSNYHLTIDKLNMQIWKQGSRQLVMFEKVSIDLRNISRKF